MGSFTRRRGEYINLHGIADMYHHLLTQSPSSDKVKDHRKTRHTFTTFTIPHNYPLIRLCRYFRLGLLTLRPPINIPCPNPHRSPASPICSLQKPTTISHNMANHTFSPSEASLSIRPSHGSGQQTQRFGVLINLVKCAFWNCCRCGHVNNKAYCPQRCGNCSHSICSSCPSYTN